MSNKMRAMWRIQTAQVSCGWCFHPMQEMTLEDVKYLGISNIRCPNCDGINVLPTDLIAKSNGVIARINPDNPPGRAPAWDGIIGNLFLKRAMEVALVGYHTLCYIGNPSIAWQQVSAVIGPRAMKMTYCPCGYYKDPTHECTCTVEEIEAWRESRAYEEAKSTDIHIEAVEPKSDEFHAWREPYTSVLSRIERVRLSQEFGRASFNRGDDRETISFLSGMKTRLDLSTTQIKSICNVALTIAEMEGKEVVNVVHVAEALQYKTLLHP